MEDILTLLGLDGWVRGVGWTIGIVMTLVVLLLLGGLTLIVILIVKNSKSKPASKPVDGMGPHGTYGERTFDSARTPSSDPIPPRQRQFVDEAPAPQVPKAVSPRTVSPTPGATSRWGIMVLRGGSSAGRSYPLEGDTMVGRGDPEEGPYPGYVEDGGRWRRFIRLDMGDRPALAKQCSRKHFWIRERRGTDGVFDVAVANKSQNPIWVDGKMLKEEGETAEVRDGSVLELAPDWKLQVCRMA